MKPYKVLLTEPTEDNVNTLAEALLNRGYKCTRAWVGEETPKHVWFSSQQKGDKFPPVQEIHEAAAEVEVSIDQILSTGYKRM